MEEKIFNLLMERTETEGRYIGGGDEPQIITLKNSENSDKESYLRSLAKDITNIIDEKRYFSSRQ